METEERLDAALVAASAQGDAEALREILRRYAPPVTRYAWAVVANQADVEDVVQDTFVTCWRKADSIVLPDSSLLPWLLATCRNLAMNRNRSRFRHPTDPLPDDLPVMHDEDDSRERLRWVLAEIEALSPLDRRVCELCLLEGRSYADAAEQLGISVGAVRQRVSRSRTRLRKAVTDNEN